MHRSECPSRAYRFMKTHTEDQELFKHVREALDIMLPPKEKEEKGE